MQLNVNYFFNVLHTLSASLWCLKSMLVSSVYITFFQSLRVQCWCQRTNWSQAFFIKAVRSDLVTDFCLYRLTAWRTQRTVNLNTSCLKAMHWALFSQLFLFFLTDITRFFFCFFIRTEGLSDLKSLTRYSSLSIWLIVGSYSHFQAMNLYW